MNIDSQAVAFIFVFLGILTRTLLPYLRKRKEAIAAGKTLAFDNGYIITAIYAIVISLVTTMLIFASFTIPETAILYVAIASFTYGYTANDIVNEVVA